MATAPSQLPADEKAMPGRGFAGAERRVLEHADDILGVPYKTLIALRSEFAATTDSDQPTPSTIPSHGLLTAIGSRDRISGTRRLLHRYLSVPSVCDALNPYADQIIHEPEPGHRHI